MFFESFFLNDKKMIFFYLIIIPIIVSSVDPEYYDIDIKGESQNGYYITSLVGTPAQHINLLIDTGSSNLAIAAVPQRIVNSTYFAYNNSRTFHMTNNEVHLRYVQGDWKGLLGTDIINPCLTANCSVFCNISCMTSMKDIFDENSKFQGILGLAYSSIAKPNSLINPFLDTFTNQKNTKNIFSLHLCGPYFSSKTSSTSCGKFRIGFNNAYLSDGVMFTPVVHEWYYEITVISLKVGLNSVPFQCQEFNKNKSIIDSGTTELNVPTTMYDFIISEIRNHPKVKSLTKFWVNETVVCLRNKPINASLFPIITLTLYHSKNSSFDLHISPELYLLPVTNLTGYCAKLGIGTSSFGIVIGSSILKGFYVLFDRENKRIGFAKPNNNFESGFVSAVSNLLVYDINFDPCIRSEVPDDTTISPLVILLLIGICIIAILFLYALLSWIWKFHIIGVDNTASDTSSLIEDDDDDFYISRTK